MTTTEPARRPLYAVTADLLALDALLDECEGDLSDPRAEAAVDAWAAELLADEGRKLDGAVAYVRQLEMEAEAARAEADEWRRRQEGRLRRARRVKGVLLDHLARTGRARVGLPSGLAVVARANGGRPPVEIDPVDPEHVPAEYRRVLVGIDQAAVRVALEAGTRLSFARLGDRGTHLRVV